MAKSHHYPGRWEDWYATKWNERRVKSKRCGMKKIIDKDEQKAQNMQDSKKKAKAKKPKKVK